MKLHLNIAGAPACGRQLSNHRDSREQLQDTLQLAASFTHFNQALGFGTVENAAGVTVRAQACRWCARQAGLLPPVRRQPRAEAEDEEPEIEMLYRELTEDEDQDDE